MGLRFFFHLLCYSFHDLYVLVLLPFQPLVSGMIYSLGTYHVFSNFKLDDLVDLENLTANLNSKGTKPSRPLLFHPGSHCFNSVSNLNQAGLLSSGFEKNHNSS